MIYIVVFAFLAIGIVLIVRTSQSDSQCVNPAYVAALPCPGGWKPTYDLGGECKIGITCPAHPELNVHNIVTSVQQGIIPKSITAKSVTLKSSRMLICSEDKSTVYVVDGLSNEPADNQSHSTTYLGEIFYFDATGTPIGSVVKDVSDKVPDMSSYKCAVLATDHS